MRYGVDLKRVMEGRFVMLLADFWCSKTGDFGGVGGGVGRAVGRGKREGVAGDFGFEAISTHDIGIFGVVVDVVGNVIGVGGGEGGAAVMIVAEGAGEGELGGVANATVEGGGGGFFACFVRTWS